jgi:hypothetical protein
MNVLHGSGMPSLGYTATGMHRQHLKAIIQSVEGLTNATYDEIQRLPIGVALISGAGLQMPLMAEIRTRETNHGGKSVGISKPGAGDDDVYEAPKDLISPNQQRMPQPLQRTAPVEKTKPVKEETPLTDKAKNVGRVAKRLGWVSTDDPDEAIKILSKEAEKMKDCIPGETNPRLFLPAEQGMQWTRKFSCSSKP